jgi:hypothetical protein
MNKRTYSTWFPSSPFARVLLCALILQTFCACHPYGDSESDLGITASNVSNSAMVGTWTSPSGDILTIRPDASVSDANCSEQGGLEYISQENNCSAGNTTCGSATLTILNATNLPNCFPQGQSICEFWTSTNNGVSNLTLSCGLGAKTTYHSP